MYLQPLVNYCGTSTTLHASSTESPVVINLCCN